MPTRSYLLPNLPTCSLKSYSTTTSNIESLFVHDTPPPMPTSQHMTYRTVLHQQWSSLGIQIFQRSEIPWRRNDWYTAPGACTTSSLLYISAGFTRTANYSESWESRLRHRWLIFQQDSSVQRWNSAKLVYSHFWWNNVLLTKLRWFYHWTALSLGIFQS